MLDVDILGTVKEVQEKLLIRRESSTGMVFYLVLAEGLLNRGHFGVMNGKK